MELIKDDNTYASHTEAMNILGKLWPEMQAGMQANIIKEWDHYIKLAVGKYKFVRTNLIKLKLELDMQEIRRQKDLEAQRFMFLQCRGFAQRDNRFAQCMIVGGKYQDNSRIAA